MNKATTKIRPSFYDIFESDVGANAVTFKVSTSEEGTVYYCVMEIGTNRRKVTRRQIYDKTLSTGIIYGN